MIRFTNNLFFVKFAVLFFILTIFGYWGIDLNSEELYIAFSFFLLVVIGFLTFRAAVATFFVSAYNAKYSKALSSQLLIFNAIGLKHFFLGRLLDRSAKSLLALESLFKYLSLALMRGVALHLQLSSVRVAALSAASTISFFSFSSLLSKERRASAFSSSFNRFFSITI